MIGKFQDNKGVIYTVTLSAGGELKQVEFSASPFVFRYDGTDDIFKPIRYGSGTVGLLIDIIPESLYTATRQGVTCEVKKEDVVIFKGYVSPNSFNQPLPNQLVDFEIEVEDCLCTLDTIKYQRTGTIISFADIISKAVTLAGLSPKNVVVAKTMTEELSDLYISEQNFFDEDGAAMTYKEILEEMMTYLNMTICQVGERVVITDMVAMKEAHFGSKDMNTLTFVGLPDISMSEVYNKIKVRSSLYNHDYYIPDLLNKEDGSDCVQEENSEDFAQEGVFTFVTKFRNNDKWELLYYDKNTNLTTDPNPHPSVDNIRNAFGGAIMKQLSYKTAEGRPIKNNWEYVFTMRSALMDGGKWTTMNIYPILRCVKSNVSSAFGNGYFCINFKCFFQPIDRHFFDSNFTKDTNYLSDKNVAHELSETYVRCRFSIGNYYWSGSEWLEGPRSFKMLIGDNGQRLYLNWLNVQNTNRYENYVDDLEGYVFKLPDGQVLIGDVKFELYIPSAGSSNAKPFFVFLKDLKVTFQKPNDYLKYGIDIDNSDTLWENVIDELNVAEKSDIDLRIATDCEKGLSFAAVLKKVGTKFEYLKTLTKGSDVGAAEEHLINACYQQYKLPRKIINATLNRVVDPHTIFNESQKKYMINSMEIDYCNNESVVQLIELSND